MGLLFLRLTIENILKSTTGMFHIIENPACMTCNTYTRMPLTFFSKATIFTLVFLS